MVVVSLPTGAGVPNQDEETEDSQQVKTCAARTYCILQ